jgi:hypothetical protein
VIARLACVEEHRRSIGWVDVWLRHATRVPIVSCVRSETAVTGRAGWSGNIRSGGEILM